MPPDLMALVGYLTEELGKLFDDALMVEPAGGVSDMWTKVLARYGVPWASADWCVHLCAMLSIVRGVLSVEFGACAHAIAAKFAAAVGEPRLIAAAEAIERGWAQHAPWIAQVAQPLVARDQPGWAAETVEEAGYYFATRGD
ncbi:hypothetical protein BH11MYX3_BH11MYX3_39960 [soil metagenome]